MTTYEQHLEFLRKVATGANHELQGFVDAMFTDRPRSEEEPRYMQGWVDGKAKLMQETKGGNASELVGAA